MTVKCISQNKKRLQMRWFRQEIEYVFRFLANVASVCKVTRRATGVCDTG